MQRTLFDAPWMRAVLQRLARFLLRIRGWRLEGELPGFTKYVMVAAPHTSNWDLPVMLTIAFAFGQRLFWMGKDSLFRGPAGWLFRWLGGIPVDRSRTNNAVAQIVEVFTAAENLVLVVAPEGTRRRVPYWKTGFYHIAAGARVPIVLGFLDYARKTGGIGPIVTPSGDLEADMKTIRAFYADIAGKHADGSGEALVAPRG